MVATPPGAVRRPRTRGGAEGGIFAEGWMGIRTLVATSLQSKSSQVPIPSLAVELKVKDNQSFAEAS